jgi:hypothetical protein
VAKGFVPRIILLIGKYVASIIKGGRNWLWSVELGRREGGEEEDDKNK